MKKVKTIILSLMLILVSSFVSACTCSGDVDVIQVYEREISIKCTTEGIENFLDEESGILTINCHKNDDFKIEYTLSPKETTTTQVDWGFDVEGIVEARAYSYSKSVCETVSFKASRTGSTTLTFTTKATGKKAVAKITVYEPITQLANFAAPSGLNYLPATGEVTWNHATTLVPANGGQTYTAHIDNGKAVGLKEYKVNVTDIATNTTETYTIDGNLNRIGGANSPVQFNKGTKYNVTVVAVADGFNALNSKVSEPFKFCQLESASNVTIDNGRVTFIAPLYSFNNEIYFSDDETVKISLTNGGTASSYSRFCKDIGATKYAELDEFNIRIKSFASQDTSEYIVKDEIRYYASDYTENKIIKKLPTPTIEMQDVKGELTIDGKTFRSDSTDTHPYLYTKFKFDLGQTYETIYGVKYQYRLTKDGSVKGSWIDITTGNSINSSERESGTYTLDVRAVGNDNNTIISEERTIRFIVLKDGNGFSDKCTINNNVIKINSLDYNVRGAELYFINSTESKRVFVESVNGSIEYNLLTDEFFKAGQHKIYGKLVGNYDSSNEKTLTTTEVLSAEAQFKTINVLNSITTNRVGLDEKVKFTGINGINDYMFRLTHKQNQTNPYVDVYITTETEVNGHKALVKETGTNNYEITLFDLIQLINVNASAEYVNGILTDKDTWVYSIVAVGDGSNTINSKASENLTFKRLKGVSGIRLISDRIIGDEISEAGYDDIRYRLGISTNGEDYYYSNDNLVVNNLVSHQSIFDLNNITVSGHSDIKLADYINHSGETHFKLQLIGREASIGGTNNSAFLNSVIAQVKFDTTQKPTDLAMDNTGTLTWKVANMSGTDNEYILSFYLKNGTEFTKAGFKQLTYAEVYQSETAEAGDGEGDGEGSQEPVITNEYFAYNIKEILERPEYIGKVVGFTIQESNQFKFAAEESEMFYARKLTSPVLNYALQSETNKPMIVWESIDGASGYDVKVDTTARDTALRSNAYIVLPDGLSVGAHTIEVNAIYVPDAVYSNSAEYPFTFDGEISSIVVNVISRNVTITPRGNEIVWNSVCDVADYNLTINNGESISINGDSTLTEYVYSGDEITSLSSGATHTISVVPVVNFVETGYMLAQDAIKTNEISKLRMVDEFTTVDGILQFNDYNDTATMNVYLIKDDVATLIDMTDNEYFDIENITEVGGNPVTPYNVYKLIVNGFEAGQNTIKIQVTKAGYLNSDFSTSYTFTKTSQVSDLDKVGEWISWKLSDMNQLSGSGELYFDLKYGKNGESTRVLKVTNQGGVVACTYQEVQQNGDDIMIVFTNNNDIFKYDSVNKIFSYKFTEEEMIAEGGSGDYAITITARLIAPNYVNGEQSAPLTLTKLNNNVTITINNGILTLSEYSQGEDTYGPDVNSGLEISIQYYTITTETITIEDEEQIKEIRHYDATCIYSATGLPLTTNEFDFMALGLNKNGNYEVRVKYLGDNNCTLTSDEFIFANEVLKLSTTSLSTLEGEIVWEKVDQAEGYNFKIVSASGTTTGQLETTEVGGETPDTEGGESGEGDGEGEPEIPGNPELITAEQLSTYPFVPGELYTVYIQAVATGKINGEWSEGFLVKKLVAPSNVRILSDTKVTTEGGVINTGEPIVKWQDNNGNILKLKYQIKYEGSESSSIETIGSSNELNSILYYCITTNLMGAQNISIRLLGSTSTGTDNLGLLTSDFSQDVVANYVDEVGTPIVVDGKISWTEVEGAYAYKVTLEYFESGVTKTQEIYVSGTSYDLNESLVLDLTAISGPITIWVNAVTDPALAIISTDHTEPLKNYTTIFKPTQLSDFKVKNGQLSWSIYRGDVEDILSFASTNIDQDGNTMQKLVSYIVGRINLDNEPNAKLDEQISSLISIKLNLNGVAVEVMPDLVKVLGDLGNTTENYSNFNKLEFYYNVGNEPEIDNGGESSGEDEVTHDAGNYTIKAMALGNSDASVSVLNSAYTSPLNVYKPMTPKTWMTNICSKCLQEQQVRCEECKGFGLIQGEGEGYTECEACGGTGETITECTAGGQHRSLRDVANGNILWELVTVDGSTSLTREYYQKYRVSAYATSGDAPITTDVTVKNSNIISDYQYYEHIKTLFVKTNGIKFNKFYNVVINTLGTVDSDHCDTCHGQTLVICATCNGYGFVGEVSNTCIDCSGQGAIDCPDCEAGEHNGTIYLNSNCLVYNNLINVLAPTTNISTIAKVPFNAISGDIKENFFTFNSSYGSVKTNLYIYGPFNNLTNEFTYNSNWNNVVYDVEAEGALKGITDEDKAKIIAMIKPLNLTISDIINRANYIEGINPTYAGAWTGGDWRTGEELDLQKHLIVLIANSFKRTIELNNENGVRINIYNVTNKAEYLPGGYVFVTQEIGNGKGIVDSVVSEQLITNKLNKITQKGDNWLGLVPENDRGMFVWNPAPIANAYRIDLYEANAEGGMDNYINSYYTTECRFDLPSDAAINDENCVYYIEITACLVDLAHNNDLVEGYFVSDLVTTDRFARINIPNNVEVDKNGLMSWGDTGESATHIGGYEVKVNFANEETVNSASSGKYQLELSSSENGTVSLQVRARAGNNYVLNSSYCSIITATVLANPIPRIVNGVFEWGTGAEETSGSHTTNSKLSIDGASAKELDASVITVPYFTELTQYDKNYKAQDDEEIYSIGSHTFNVQFLGSDIDSNNIYINSRVKTLQAVKLASPVLESVNIDVGADFGSGNSIKWTKVANASGYRVIVFFEQGTMRTYSTLDNDQRSAYFKNTEYNESDNNCYFILNEVIKDLAGGSKIYIYCQAIGTQNSLCTACHGLIQDENCDHCNGNGYETIPYLSSSYSNSMIIVVPSSPKNIRYNSDTATLSWDNVEEDKMNILIVATYVVNNVTAEDFNNYWKLTANSIGQKFGNEVSSIVYGNNADYNQNINEYSQIKDRRLGWEQISENKYKLYITDSIMLLADNVTMKTPSSYVLTSLGEYSEFVLTTSTSQDLDYDGTYKSIAVSNNDLGICVFGLFEKGDGSKAHPYVINQAVQLERVRLFKDRSFRLGADIVLTNVDDPTTPYKWEMIAGHYTGVFDGANHTISNLYYEGTDSIDDDNYGYTAWGFMEYNDGIIKNLTLELKSIIKDAGGYSGAKAGGLVVENGVNGQILNVVVQSNGISLTLGVVNDGGLKLGGIVAINKGLVDGSSFQGNLTGLGQDNITRVGGIVAINYIASSAIISNCHFNGNIVGNMIGGIASENGSIINRCYTEGTLYPTNEGRTAEDAKRGGYAGGIAGRMNYINNMSVKDGIVVSNSYSLMTIRATQNGGNDDSAVYIAGLVAGFDAYSDGTCYVIKNCYAVVDFFGNNNAEKLHATALIAGGNATAVALTDCYYIKTTTNSLEITDDANQNATGNPALDMESINADALTILKTKLNGITDTDGETKIYNTESETSMPTLKNTNPLYLNI